MEVAPTAFEAFPLNLAKQGLDGTSHATPVLANAFAKAKARVTVDEVGIEAPFARS